MRTNKLKAITLSPETERDIKILFGDMIGLSLAIRLMVKFLINNNLKPWGNAPNSPKKARSKK